MKKILIIIFLFASQLHATEYYVSNLGNDELAGNTEATAWRTIDKVNRECENFKPGDVIAFKRGDIFYGELKIYFTMGSLSNKIIFTSYGVGEDAVISGEQKISNWNKDSGNVYEAEVEENVYQLFLENASVKNVRLPEIGFYEIDNVENQQIFTSKDLIGRGDLVGSTICVYPYVWYVNSSKIIEFNSGTGTVTLEKNGLYDISKGNDFFILNEKSLLRQKESWSYDIDKKKLYYYSNAQPKDISVAVSNSIGIHLKNCNNIRISNLSIKKFNGKGIYSVASSNVVIENCRIDQVYDYGIYSERGSQVEVSNNLISNCNQTAIYADSGNMIVKDNEIVNIGLIDNISFKGYSQPYAIEVWQKEAVVSNNRISNIGYIGIRFYGRNTIIENNYIEKFCLDLHDGGAIYTYNTEFTDPVGAGSIIRSNIIIGDDSSDKDRSIFGIYMDDRSHDIEITENSITNTNIGIFLHNTKRHKVTHNVIYKPFKHGIGLFEDYYGGDGEMTENQVHHNEIFLLNKDMYAYPLLSFSVFNNYNFGTFNNNTYYNPYNKRNIGVQNKSIYWYNIYQPRSMALKDWQELYSQDLSSNENDFYWDSFIVQREKGDNLIINEDFDSQTPKWSSEDSELSIFTESNGNNCLKVSSSLEDAALFSNVFEVADKQQYLLEFDVKSNTNLTLKLALNRINSPYSDLLIRPIWIDSEWQHYAIPIDSEFNASDIRLNFYFPENGGVFYLDNVKFTNVEFAKDIPERSKFIYNEDSSVKEIPLVGLWQDLKGEVYKDKIKLKAHSSKILILSDQSISEVKANAGEDTEICQGKTVILRASGGSSYQWSTGETTQSIEVSPEKTTTYTVIAAEGSESATDEVIVSVTEVLVNAGADRTISKGESISLTATGGDTYLWSTGATTETIAVSPNTTDIYSVTATKGSCDDTDEVKVIVNPSTGGGNPVTANAGADISICMGESTTLTASGGSSYSWNTGATSQSITVSPNSTTSFTVKVSEGSESATDEVIVSVTEVLANAGADRTITEGESVSLTATGGDSYLWSTGAITKTIKINPSATNTYFVTVFKGDCQDSDEVTVKVDPAVDSDQQPANADAGDDITICLGQSIVLNGSGGDIYEWNNGATTKEIEVSPSITTTYMLTASRGGFTNTDEVTITVENCNENETSDDDDLAILRMNIYPNPTKGELYISIDNLANETNFIINDAKGSTIYHEVLSHTEKGFDREIDLSKYTSGLYLIRLFNEEHSLIKKVIVQ